MTTREIQPVIDPADEKRKLERELEDCQQALLESEAMLAREQADVNAFRMHCRLKLDRWIEKLLSLQTERQRLLTRLALLRQAEDLGIPFDEEDPFWSGDDDAERLARTKEEESLILPTDVPRDKAAEKRLYRQLARKFHPDLSATAVEIAYRTDMMSTVNQAYESGDIQALYDLAGELDPEETAALAAIKSKEIRRLKRQIVRLEQRQRRAQRRLSVLKEENTARLWYKAKRLDAKDVHWWEIVRREIEIATDRVSRQVSDLRAAVEHLEAESADTVASSS